MLFILLVLDILDILSNGGIFFVSIKYLPITSLTYLLFAMQPMAGLLQDTIIIGRFGNIERFFFWWFPTYFILQSSAK